MEPPTGDPGPSQSPASPSPDELQQVISILRATLESTADGILVVDREGRILSSNRQFASMWRIPDEVLSTRDDDRALECVLDQLAEPERFLAKVRELYATPEGESFDVLRFKDGRVFERFSRPRRVGGRAVGRVWSFRDVTDRKRLEAELLQAQKLEAVGRLAGGIAHDFNNLLTTIFGHTDLVLRSPELDAGLREEVEEIQKAGERAAALTRQLLAFSRKQVIAPRDFNLNALVLDHARMLARLIGDDVELSAELEASPATVRADPVQIEQVIINLAVNARDAMPGGGRLSIATRRVRVEAGDAPVELAPGDYVRLEVADTGTGMDPGTLARAFEPFFTTKELGKGTGLGLSTAYGIVRQSGGAIAASSEPGRGTTFEIYLPSAAEPPAAPSPHPAADGAGRTVLLAEDESALRSLTRRILESSGFVVLAAADAEEALRIADSYGAPPDVLVTDVEMPGLSGGELARRLGERHPELKVLFMSGFIRGASGGEKVLAAEAHFLQKPFTPRELLQKIRDVLAS